MSMNLFAQITKVDQAKRLVYGRACQEVVDRSGEIFDYQTSVPYFKAWSDGIGKDTDGKSLGNVRAMHGKISAGKVTAIDFNDGDKAVDICAKIVDDNEWNKVQEGCYTGFSIGGSYVGDKKTEKIADKDVVRYTANPTEISLVDQPCVPTAKFFDIVKADGAIEKVAFQMPAPDPSEVQGTNEEVAAFAKALNDGGLKMADAIRLVKEYTPTPHPLIVAVADMLKAEGVLVAELDAAKGEAFDALIAKQLTPEEVGAVAKAAPGAMVKGLRGAVIAKGTGAYTQKIHDMLGEMGAKCAKAAEGDLSKSAPDIQKMVADAVAAAVLKMPVPHVTLRAMTKGAPEKTTGDSTKVGIESLTKEDYVLGWDGKPDYVLSLAQKQYKVDQAKANS